MTSLLSAKKRAEEFAAVVDGGADRSDLRPELMELVGVVSGLRREGQVGSDLAPRPEFTAMLRERLLAEAATSLPQDNVLMLPTRRKGGRERRIALVASSLVLVGGSAGMAAAAQNALPGEALYPIKRGLEKAQVDLATSSAGRGQDLLDQADSRLLEVQGLFESSSNLSQVPETLDDFTAQAIEASGLLLDSFEESRDPAIIDQLHAFASDNLSELQQLATTAPPEHQDELAVAAEALVHIDEQAQAACPTCAEDLPSLEMPPLFLTANDAREAMHALGGARVNNDHPVMTGAGGTNTRGTQQRPPDDSGTGASGTGGTDGGEGTGDAGGSGGTPESGVPGLPDLPSGGVDTSGTGGGDDLGKTIKKGTDTSGDAGSKIKDALPEDLDPLVDTLVP